MFDACGNNLLVSVLHLRLLPLLSRLPLLCVLPWALLKRLQLRSILVYTGGWRGPMAVPVELGRPCDLSPLDPSVSFAVSASPTLQGVLWNSLKLPKAICMII